MYEKCLRLPFRLQYASEEPKGNGLHFGYPSLRFLSSVAGPKTSYFLHAIPMGIPPPSVDALVRIDAFLCVSVEL